LEKMATDPDPDPDLIKKMASVKDERKRKFKKPSKSVVKKIALKKVNYERRVENLDEEMAKEKDRSIVSGIALPSLPPYAPFVPSPRPVDFGSR
jgi:hypothetical protein